ncbi:MAG: asparagine--tRNA ligase [Firmicutes bacterium]|nr:asparagine--tRNA ligase [Bacillota bacterium]
MKHTEICELFKNQSMFLDKSVTVCGWVRTSRESKTMSFIELNDGSTMSHIQIVVQNDSKFPNGIFDLGAALKVDGVLVKTQKGDSVEINADNIEVLGGCPADYPLQKKRHGMDFLRTIPHLRVRTNSFGAIMRVRSVLSFAIHSYFVKNGYTYAHTPILTGSDCEGAGEVFRVTTHEWATKHKTEDDYYGADFFGKKAGLTVSGQLEGEVAALSLGKIYTFAPAFRSEKSNTTRHAAEFWLIEPEVAFADLSDMLNIAEDFIKYIIAEVLNKCENEIKFFDTHMENGLIEKLNNVVKNKFEVLEYTKAVEILEKSGQKFSYPVKWGLNLQAEHEKYLTEVVYKKPAFVINYPADIKSFYMKKNPDGKTVAAMDLLLPGIGEIIGGSQREDDYDKLLESIRSRGMREDDYKGYLELRKFGSCQHSGFGLGLERILMYITGVSNIRDVQLFPRTVGYMA